MKFQLKAIKFYESMSEETNCFQGKLYINNKYVADVKNTGQGGNTDVYHLNKLTGSIISEAEKYLSHQPKKKCDVYDFEYIRTIESEVDDLFADWLKVKADKKFEKEMDKGILYGKDKKYSYYIQPYNVPIKAMLMSVKGKEILRNKILEIQQGGNIVFNTNIPDDVMGK